jgi:2-methylisocitrate lyase-like PEP mutase family enzyme
VAQPDLVAMAERLRALHAAPGVLVLPNAWDAASARAFADADSDGGFPAIATTSAGVVEALGHRDGEQAPVDEVLAAVGRICRAVPVPVTADLEGGYGLAPDDLVEGMLEAGAVGLNLEDTDHRGPGPLVDADVQAGRLAAVKEAARRQGVDIVLNARVDVHVRQVGPEDERLAEAVRRGRLYREAGADCLYPIAVADEPTIRALVEETGAPINVLLRPGVPPVSRLAELGVVRATFGSGLMRAAVRAARQLAEAARDG